MPRKQLLSIFYALARQLVPNATEEMSYAMPSFKYKGKGLVAIMANKNFLSLYPFGSIEKLHVDVSDFEQTSGSVHFTTSKPISDKLFTEIIKARLGQIDSN